MTLNDWATKHGVSVHALRELVDTCIYTPPLLHDFTEAGVQSRVRLEAARSGHLHLWRNNVGAGKIEGSGQFMRWGLANESKGVNEVVKSADLIGIDSQPIKLADVGQPRGRLVSREIKHGKWTYSGTPEEDAQARWALLINASGGDAKIVTGIGSL